jgi:uncharacterized membrane protein
MDNAMPAERAVIAEEKLTELPVFPETSTEYVNSLAHFYRGELGRMVSWRDRLDRTTNWAVAASAAMLSVVLSSPDAPHGVLLCGMVLIFLLLWIESRRYRFYDVFRTRVRMLERHYYAGVLNPNNRVDTAQWMRRLSTHLRSPEFSLTYQQAMARRLQRNYVWLFLLLLVAWFLKVTTLLVQLVSAEASVLEWVDLLLHSAAVGYVPGWLVLAGVAVFYGSMFYLMFRHGSPPGELGHEDRALV